MEKIVIKAGGNVKNYWKDIVKHKELFFFLAWRDVLVQYKQTIIGVSWSIIRPLLTIVVFSVVFGKIAKFPSGGLPYPIFVFAATLPWQFFANSLNLGSMSLVNNGSLVSKIYFPRLIIPSTSLVVSFIDFIISFIIFIVMMFFYNVNFSWRLFLIPGFLIILALFVLGLSYWFSALNVKYRDFRYLVPFIVQLGLYISPVGFSSSIVPKSWQLLYACNPMVGIIDGFRWMLGDGVSLFNIGFLISIGVAILTFVSGIFYFRKAERVFADFI